MPTRVVRRRRGAPASPNGANGASRKRPTTRYGSYGVRALYASAFLLLLAGVGLAFVYVRLSQNPIQLDELVPPIEAGINSELVGHRIDIGGAELRLGPSGGFEFRLRDLSVFEKDGKLVAKAPLAAVALSGKALLLGRIVPARIELIQPTVQFVYTEAQGLVVNRGVDTQSASPTDASTGADGSYNIIKRLSETSQQARKRVGATGYLNEVAVSQARILLDYQGQRSIWTIPEASIDLDHSRRRSLMVGQAKIASDHGPWSVSFVTNENARTNSIDIKITVRGLYPAALGAAAPPFALMSGLEAPVSGDTTIVVAANGEIERADVAMEIGRGRIVHADLRRAFEFSGGLFKLAFDGSRRQWTLEPSPVRWSGGQLMLAGTATDEAKADAPPTWRFDFKSGSGAFAAPEFGVPEIAVKNWHATGTVVPRVGRVELEKLEIAAGDGAINVRAVIDAENGQPNTFAEVRTSAMPVDTLKAIWPVAVAPGAREWVGENVRLADVKPGTAQLLSGTFIPEATRAAFPERNLIVGASFEAENVTFSPLDGMPPIFAPKADINLKDNALDVRVADGNMALDDGRMIPLSDGRISTPDVVPDRPAGRIAFKTKSDLGAFLEAVERLPLPAVEAARPLPRAAEGRIEADIQIDLPLHSDVPAHEVAVLGKAKITDGQFGKVGGQFDVQGFTLNLDLTEERLGAKGDLLVNGVPAKIIGERVFSASAADQPPVRIAARLDAADRRQLGIDIDDFVSGTIDLDVSYDKGGDGTPPAIKVVADLAAAGLTIKPLGWSKPAGTAAKFSADVVTADGNKTLLKNVKISGDTVAVAGEIALDDKKEVSSFAFPQVSLDVVSRLDVRGKRSNEGIWSVNVKGSRFDGRNLFKSFFSISDGNKSDTRSGKSAGTDVQLAIDNVLGSNDVTVRNLTGQMSMRAGKLTAIDMRGRQTSGGHVAVAMDRGGGARRLRIESQNAGELMRLVDFYPNMQGGNLKLEINLDGRGDAEKTGVLWIERFQVLGDPVVSEVVGSADQSRAGSGGKRKVTREIFQFDLMNAPFSLGYGQFVLEDAYVKGPLVGANLRGKADFRARRVDLGGTYIPLQGLNSALGGIPVLGQLISGSRGEGIFGITFAVQGAMSNPQVIVNPLSLVAPGIFREIFQMTPYNPKVRARKTPQAGGAAPGQSLDGWSSTTSPRP